MHVPVLSLLVGAASFVPGVSALTARRTGGSCSARYCYGVWLRHLVHMHAIGLPTRFGTMAELGPGDTLGVGLAALLSCVDRYVGLDCTPYAGPERNRAVFDALVGLFRERAAIPDEREFPGVFPRLTSHAFPHDILTQARMDAALDPARVAALREALRAPPAAPGPGDLVSYAAPWGPDVLPAGSVDFVFSHAVLHLPGDLPGLYQAMDRWLRPGGVMSHEVDFKSIGRTRAWNGHWACPELTWAIVQGRRRNQLNRVPASGHRAILDELGFETIGDVRDVRRSGIERAQLTPRFAGLSDADLTTASALLQSRKPARADAAEQTIARTA